MKKKNRKYSLIILLSLVVIGINLLAVSRRSGKITGKRSARIDGAHYYKNVCRPVTLIGRRNRQLPEGKAALLIAFNKDNEDTDKNLFERCVD